MHPAVVLLVVLLGGSVTGLLGLVLAVPLAASVRVVVQHLRRRSVSWSNEPEPSHDPEPAGDPEPDPSSRSLTPEGNGAT